ncbi:MAG: aminotransferase class III-fold pyridoxal phosphate-dependent enzyme [Gammaproteobacteria bacterium]|nr:aminotransferase class III-fold pyridoxal phosphate-dependent enzyme [Gammaproteobacteria bacterium]
MTPEFENSQAWYQRAQAVIPGGIPGIRAPENFVPGAYPTLLAGGSAGHVRDVDGNDYVDMLLGYGPVILGHAETEVDAAARARAAAGFCLNLPEPIMVELAERLVALVPSAEQVLFFKTGSDATSAAVRLARAHTGRTIILRCGYHGWHDWCLEADPGVPMGATEDVEPFRYNDLDQLRNLLKRHAGRVAGIILTPIGHNFDRQIEPPAQGFLQGVRALADDHDVVLCFDEVRTGFRVHAGGAQALYGVTPDLTALGKAMSNGYAVTALVGKASVMASAGSTFISSTYFPNGMEMAAALATLTILERESVLNAIEARGRRLAVDLEQIVRQQSLPVTLSPYPQMPFLHFDDDLATGQPERRDRFYATLAEHGVFAHPRHHGFLCWRHSDDDVDRLLGAVDRAGALV